MMSTNTNTVRHRSDCPISCTLDVLGDKWTLLIVRDMVWLRYCNFKEFLTSDEAIATNILTDRLVRLCAQGLIVKTPDPDNGRQIIYTLTARGLALIPVLVDLAFWGSAVARAGEGDPNDFKVSLKGRDQLIAKLTEEYREKFNTSSSLGTDMLTRSER